MSKKAYISVAMAAIFSLCISFTRAQDTSAHTLNEALIINNRYHSEQIGFKSNKPDSLLKNQFSGFQLSDLIAYTNTFFVKSYGGNGIASSSIRGASSAQSTVNWNGFTINNPMLGQSDLSILPSFFFEDIDIVSGGNACLAGSGALGGTVYLKNKVLFGNSFNIKSFLNYTSFNSIRSGASIQVARPKFTNATKLFYNGGTSNYLYGDTIEGVYTQKKLTHTNLVQFGLLQENNFKINKYQKASIHLWMQSSNKQLPNSLSESISKKSQLDASSRTSADWQLTKNDFSLFARTALLFDRLDYTDSLSNIFSKSKSLVSISELEAKFIINAQHSIDLGLNANYSKGITKSYAIHPYLLKYASFASWKFENKKKWFSSNLCVRQELIVNGSKPLVWTAGFQIRPFAFAKIHGNVGKVFRLPSLNDLYWNPGGNPTLKPEQGFTEEIGLELKRHKNDLSLLMDITGFNRNVTNWIAWLPSGNGIWSPINILEVWSRGCETQFSVSYTYKKWKFNNRVSTNYILSTYQKSINDNDASIGRQLIYTPMYSGNNLCILSYKNFSFMYSISYTGYRYLSSDNYQYLKPYWLNNTSINYQFKHKSIDANVFMGIENLFNRSYQVVAANPMPLRYVKVGLQFQFNKQ